MKRKSKSLGMAPVARGGTAMGYSESAADTAVLQPRGPLGPSPTDNDYLIGQGTSGVS